MRRIPAPSVTAQHSYRTSISGVADAGLQKRLSSIVADVVAASNQFEVAAKAGTLSSIASATSVGPVTKKELGEVYTFRFAGAHGPGRPIYDQLRSSAPMGRCPLCGQRQVSTLDHFLPKSKHPALAVAPLNLVPACKDCNTAKLAKTASSPTSVTLHPYFDDIEGEQWLRAEVRQTAPASLRFKVVAPEGWAPILASRVRHHFETFGLSELYSVYAGEEIRNIQFELTALFESGGSGAVGDHLRRGAMSRANAQLNSWQTATYEALADSRWFCATGFRGYSPETDASSA